ncbi:MAG TPA: helix-turn-helix domain-containing protein [Thermoanaerobaculia bacterium]|nr:helix-turn-helix domain-containing protein [Thermoanaerobaculia bacterium]
MIAHQYRPPPPLGEFVEVIWYYRGYRQEHAFERILPSGRMALVVNLAEDETRVWPRGHQGEPLLTRGSSVDSELRQHFVIDTAEQEFVAGAHFHPGGAFPFFGVAADELAGHHLSLEELWGESRANELRSRLLAARSPQAAIEILEQALCTAVKRPLARHPAVAFALAGLSRAPATATVARLVRGVGLSPRRFLELFRQEVGLGPKAYCRVRRFQAALALAWGRPVIDWARLALDCGYYDQAHLIRDFRAFSGLAPRAYLASRGQHLNHLPILD